MGNPPQGPYGLPPSGQPTPLQEGEFQPAVRNREVYFAKEGIDPPSQSYVDADDILEFGVMPFIQNGIFQANIRILRPHGGVEVVQITTPSVGGNAVNVQTQQLREGYILSAAVITTPASSTPNTAYAWLALRRAGNAAKNQARVLCSGYVSNQQALAFPDRPAMRCSDGNGVVAWQTASNPAAGADWTYSPLSTQRVQVLCILAKLVTSATVATRTVTLQGNNAAGQFMAIDSPNTQIASLTRLYCFYPGAFAGGAGGNNLPCPLPGPLLLHNSDSISTSTANLQAGDQWSNIIFQVVLWASEL